MENKKVPDLPPQEQTEQAMWRHWHEEIDDADGHSFTEMGIGASLKSFRNRRSSFFIQYAERFSRHRFPKLGN